MRAVKDNKEYNVDESTKSAYLAAGFTILDDSGNVLELPAGAAISYDEHKKVQDELAAARKELDRLKKKE